MVRADSYYEYEEDGVYCYPGTYVLRNKLGITDAKKLHHAERRFSAIRLAQLDERGFFLDGSFDSKHLRAIHRFIFQDLYSWAGEYRTVNISKGSTFCMFQFIDSQLDELFANLHQERQLEGLAQEEMTVRLAFYLGELNAIHPFREGNGRTQRAFVRQLAYINGYLLSFASITNNEMIRASIKSFNGEGAELEEIIARCLNKID